MSAPVVEGTSVTPRQRPKPPVMAGGLPPPIGSSPTPKRQPHVSPPPSSNPPKQFPVQPPARTPQISKNNSIESCEALFPPSGKCFCLITVTL